MSSLPYYKMHKNEMTTYVTTQYENSAEQKISARQWSEQYFKQNKIKKNNKKTNKPTKNNNKTIQNKKKEAREKVSQVQLSW